MSANIEEILTSLGYNLNDRGEEWRCRPIYRESGNDTSLRISKESGYWQDFSAGKKGRFEDLIQITLNLKSVDEAKELLNSKYKFVPTIRVGAPKIRMPKKYPLSALNQMLPIHDYWVGRGISLSVIKKFKGGVFTSGKHKDRYVLPIFNTKGELQGGSGRTLANSPNKWKHIGNTKEWIYPLFLNEKDLKVAKYIILVESPGCVLSFFEMGIHNVLCLFGIEISSKIIAELIKIDPRYIVIATNNEPENDGIGNKAAEVIQNTLRKHFDYNQVLINLPDKKDFNEMLVDNKESINLWKKNLEARLKI